MSGHAELQRKDLVGKGAASAASIPHNALAEASPVQALAATGRILNARPALVAQHRLAAHLSRAPRMAPIQRMNNGQPPPAPVVAEEEWGDYQAAPQPAPGGNAGLPAAVVNAPAAANPGIVPAVVADPPVIADPPVVADPLGAAANADAAAAPIPAAVPLAAAPAAVVAAPAAANGVKVETGAHTPHNGPMYTVGLVNCIALVAYNPNTPLASLYHWNTADGGLAMEEDEDGALDDDGNPKTHFVPDQAGVDAAKAVVDGDVAGANAYHAVLGTGWDVGGLAPVRQAFVAMLRDRFAGITIAAALHGSARWVAPNLTGY